MEINRFLDPDLIGRRPPIRKAAWESSMKDSSREGVIEGFSLGSLLLLVDYTGRLFRTGKATISAELAGTFARLGSTAESWRARLEKLRTRRLFGRLFAASRERLRVAAARLSVRRVGNLAGCPAL
jgi:hypothetical protein